jgi:hypothetical protein
MNRKEEIYKMSDEDFQKYSGELMGHYHVPKVDLVKMKREELNCMKLLANIVKANLQQYKNYAEKIGYPLYNDSVDTVIERLESDIDTLSLPSLFVTSIFVNAYQRSDGSWVVQEEDGRQHILNNDDFWKKYRRVKV